MSVAAIDVKRVNSMPVIGALSPPPSPTQPRKQATDLPPPKKKRHPSLQLDKFFRALVSGSTFSPSSSPSSPSSPSAIRTANVPASPESLERMQARMPSATTPDRDISPALSSSAAAKAGAESANERPGVSSILHQTAVAAEHSEIANINAQADAQGRRVIFVPIANDPHSVSRQVAWLLESGILKPEEDLVVLAHVRAPYKELLYAPDILTEYSDVITTTDDSTRQQARALVSTTAQFLAKHNIAVRAIIVQGDSAHTIVRKAQELSAALVILGDNKGEGVFKRAIHGSTTDFCTHHLKCTIVIAK